MIATALAAVSRALSGAAVEWRCDARSTRQRIYFGNHSSHLDFIVIWSALPCALRGLVRPVAGSDYWTSRPLRRYVAEQVFDAILIERTPAGGDPRMSAAAAVRRMADRMGDRHSLIVFPEGTRAAGGEVGPFKSGLYHLSRLRPDVELIPVSLENLHRILPKGEVLPIPLLSHVVFGPPLAWRAGDDKAGFLARARQALIELRIR
jgi:1-acyl-sn-glycerol-3-phosphate acyltransferase